MEGSNINVFDFVISLLSWKLLSCATYFLQSLPTLISPCHVLTHHPWAPFLFVPTQFVSPQCVNNKCILGRRPFGILSRLNGTQRPPLFSLLAIFCHLNEREREQAGEIGRIVFLLLHLLHLTFVDCGVFFICFVRDDVRGGHSHRH